MTVRVLTGDCRALLDTLDAGSAQCVVTSPPYWGLRDYGVEGQLGLERTPDEYVANMVDVFRRVRRVLKDDGTLWLNLGDSYVASACGVKEGGVSQRSGLHGAALSQKYRETLASGHAHAVDKTGIGLAPKNLVGIPWRVAFALQQPYYAGSIRDERDRIWLAAMLDAEGCMFIHKRKAGQHNGQGYYRQSDNYGPGVEIANTSRAVVDRVLALVGKGTICEQGPEQNGRRRQTIYRWNLRTVECREFVRELYPYLVAKQHQARLLYACPSSGKEAEAAHAGLMALHRGSTTDVDFPAPPSLFERGWYLRSDVIWSKLNPMPESVTDRPTKAHEYLFLLAKSERYYYDAEAIAEDVAESQVGRIREDVIGGTSHVERGQHSKGGTYSTKPRESVKRGGFNGKTEAMAEEGRNAFRAVVEKRNRRTVWTVATQPFSGAHFATFPPKLIEPCILAGSKRGDTVLDPFGGAGTTGLVADRLGRGAILMELNPTYAAMASERIRSDAPLFADGAA